MHHGIYEIPPFVSPLAMSCLDSNISLVPGINSWYEYLQPYCPLQHKYKHTKPQSHKATKLQSYKDAQTNDISANSSKKGECIHRLLCMWIVIHCICKRRYLKEIEETCVWILKFCSQLLRSSFWNKVICNSFLKEFNSHSTPPCLCTLSRIWSNFSSDLIKDRVLSWNKNKNLMSSKSMYSVDDFCDKSLHWR